MDKFELKNDDYYYNFYYYYVSLIFIEKYKTMSNVKETRHILLFFIILGFTL